MTAAIAIEEIVAAVSGAFGIDHSAMMGRSRLGPVARARQAAMWLAVKLTPLPYQAIGEAFGRDRTTVRHAFEAIEAAMASDAWLAQRLDDLRYRFSAGGPEPAVRPPPSPAAFSRGVELVELALAYTRRCPAACGCLKAALGHFSGGRA